MKGSSARELIPSLNWTFTLQLSQGIFENDSILVKILNLLDVKRLIYNKQLGLSKKGLHFNAIKGDINITNGTMDLKDFRVNSPLFNAVGYGTIDLPYSIQISAFHITKSNI